MARSRGLGRVLNTGARRYPFLLERRFARNAGCRRIRTDTHMHYGWQPVLGGSYAVGRAMGQELGQRREFSALSRTILTRVAAAEPYGGQCPCCGRARVLAEDGRAVPGAEFDHFLHRGLNRPEHGWLVCTACHGELTHGGYLVRFARTPEFRAFQTRVLERRRRARPGAGDQPR
jgi:hypothetical protein